MEQVGNVILGAGLVCVGLTTKALFVAALVYVIYKIVQHKRRTSRLQQAWFEQAFRTNKNLEKINSSMPGNSVKAETAPTQEQEA